MRRVFLFVILSLSLSGIGWAACEEEIDVFERAQKKLSATQAALNKDLNSLKAQQEKTKAWKYWRETKEARDLCGQKHKKDIPW